MTKKLVTFGEIMMRLSTPGWQRFTQVHSFNVHYGGSEANVGMALAQWGVGVAHVTRFPDNDFGHAATATLASFGVQTSHICYGPQRMGLYFLENGAMQRSSRVIYDRFDSAFAHIAPGMINWEIVFEGVDWFHWTGITPAISAGAASVLLEALKIAKQKRVTISADINYRRNLWQYGKTALDVMPELISYADHIVAGATDIENCLGISGDSLSVICSNVVSECPSIRSISWTTRESISSSHNKLSGAIWSKGKEFVSRQFDLLPIVDRVGGGDAFMAGLIYGWMNYTDPQQIIDFAVAASAWKHSVEGDVNIATVEEVESLRESRNVGKLLR
jgi:2-dehydro-3-deoxygluconokinase